MFELIFYVLIFLISCGAFYFSGELIVNSLTHLAKFLKWKEFAVSFLIMAVVAAFPNLFVGIISALNGIPQLSFADVLGGNVVDLTLAVALAALFSQNGIPAQSRTIQITLSFTAIAAVLPVLLAWDGLVSRADGIILILFYVIYLIWLFSKKENFSKVCEETPTQTKLHKKSNYYLFNALKVTSAIIIFLFAAQGIVSSAQYFAETFNWSLILIGLFVVSIGNAAPEIFFAITCAKKNNGWMILGDLMGAVIGSATFVLGIVALINPIEIKDFSPFAVARFFTVLGIFFFFIFTKSDQRISKKEAAFLLFLYIAFIVAELFAQSHKLL